MPHGFLQTSKKKGTSLRVGNAQKVPARSPRISLTAVRGDGSAAGALRTAIRVRGPGDCSRWSLAAPFKHKLRAPGGNGPRVCGSNPHAESYNSPAVRAIRRFPGVTFFAPSGSIGISSGARTADGKRAPSGGKSKRIKFGQLQLVARIPWQSGVFDWRRQPTCDGLQRVVIRLRV